MIRCLRYIKFLVIGVSTAIPGGKSGWTGSLRVARKTILRKLIAIPYVAINAHAPIGSSHNSDTFSFIKGGVHFEVLST